MNATAKNTIFISIAAWLDWERKAEYFLRSAAKQEIDVILLDKGKRWEGFYHHKVSQLVQTLERFHEQQPQLEYVVYTDARDVVFVKSQKEIFKLLNSFDDDKVWFNADKPRTWPFQARWFVRAIERTYGAGNIANSGCYVGRIENVISLLRDCVQLHSRLVEQKPDKGTIEALLINEMKASYLQDDQYHIQALQALGSSKIAIDKDRQVFACFDGGFPLLKTAPEKGSNGTMPLGTAGILHSPWMLMRSNRNPENLIRWRHWAMTEEII